MPKVSLKKPTATMNPPAVSPEVAEKATLEQKGQAPFLEDGFPNPRAAANVFDYMANYLRPQDWQEVIGYLWRVEPRQVRIDGIPGYLLKFKEPIDQEYIMQKYGGTIFKIMLNRKIGGREVNLWTQAPIPIEAIPIMQNNEKFLNTGPTAANGNGGSHDGDLLRTFISDTIKQRDDARAEGKTFDLNGYLQTAAANGLQIQQQAFLASIASMKENAGGGNSKFMDMMMTEMAKRMFAPAPAPKTLTEQLAELTALKETLGAGATAATDSVAVAITQAIAPHVPGLFKDLKDISTNVLETVRLQRGAPPANTRPQQRPTAAATPQQPAAVNTTPPPQAVFTPAGIAPGATAAPPAPAPSPEFTPQAAPVENTTAAPSTTLSVEPGMPMEARARQAHQLILKMFYDGNPGADAAFVLDILDDEYALQLANKLSTDPRAVAALPEFLPILQDPRLPEFVKNFVDWFDQQIEASPPTEN